jgi:hypothetical protein
VQKAVRELKQKAFAIINLLIIIFALFMAKHLRHQDTKTQR